MIVRALRGSRRIAGALTPVETVEAGGTVMPMALSPNHLRLYAGIRSQPYRVLGFALNPLDGRLTRIATTPTEKQPRGFAIDPSGHYLLAVGQLSTSLRVYRIDTRSGALAPLGEAPVGKGANWIEMVDFGGSNGG
ncbi:lactonase family protein [Burkholderia gladioli]|uniref:lactonase family protein n=1 Tax=Burkholderia gladioli TaxID=28095 RepID=UPI0038B347EB